MQALGAARLGDQIGHGAGLVGLLAGAVVGAVAGAAIAAGTVASGGLLAGLIIAGSVGLGGTAANQLLKGIKTISQLPDPTTGALAYSTLNVTVNGRGAMRAGLDGTMVCAGGSGIFFSHPPLPIFGMPGFLPVAEGSETVRINGKPAGRITSRLICGGTIKTASEDVRFGGPPKTVAFVWDWTGWLETGFQWLGGAGVIGGAAVAVKMGAAALGGFALILGGTMLGFEALGALGDSLGEGYRDLFQGAFGMGLLLAGWKMAPESFPKNIQDVIQTIRERKNEPLTTEEKNIIEDWLTEIEKDVKRQEAEEEAFIRELEAMKQKDKKGSPPEKAKEAIPLAEEPPLPKKPLDQAAKDAADKRHWENEREGIKREAARKLFGGPAPEPAPEPRPSQAPISGEIVDPPASSAGKSKEEPLFIDEEGYSRPFPDTSADAARPKDASPAPSPYPPDPPLKARGPSSPTLKERIENLQAALQGEPPRVIDENGELVDIFGIPIEDYERPLYFKDENGNLQPLRKVNTGDEVDPAYVVTTNDDLYPGLPVPEEETNPHFFGEDFPGKDAEGFPPESPEETHTPFLEEDFSVEDAESFSIETVYPLDPPLKAQGPTSPTSEDNVALYNILFKGKPPRYFEGDVEVDAFGIPVSEYGKALYFADENGVLQPLRKVNPEETLDPAYTITANDDLYPALDYPASVYPPAPLRPNHQLSLDEAQLREITVAEESLESLLTQEETLPPLRWEEADRQAMQTLLDKPKKLTRSLSPWKDISILEEDATEGVFEPADYYVDENGMIQLLRDVFGADKGEQPLLSHNDPPRASNDIPASSNDNKY